jgi:small-conductance mechanosensitive channel
MQGIHTYIPETNRVSTEHRVATILVLLFMVLISLVPALTPLHLYVSTFRSMCAVPNMVVICSFLTSWFPGMLFTYFLNDFEMVPVAPLLLVSPLFLHSKFYIIIIITIYFYCPQKLFNSIPAPSSKSFLSPC